MLSQLYTHTLTSILIQHRTTYVFAFVFSSLLFDMIFPSLCLSLSSSHFVVSHAYLVLFFVISDAHSKGDFLFFSRFHLVANVSGRNDKSK